MRGTPVTFWFFSGKPSIEEVKQLKAAILLQRQQGCDVPLPFLERVRVVRVEAQDSDVDVIMHGPGLPESDGLFACVVGAA